MAAVVLNCNYYGGASACVKSLQSLDPGGDRVVIVDNGSTDGSRERLDEDFPEVEVRFTHIEKWFSGGHDGDRPLSLVLARQPSARRWLQRFRHHYNHNRPIGR